MRKNIKLLLLSILLITFQFSCDKTDIDTINKYHEYNSQTIIELAKVHFATYSKNKRVNDEVNYLPKWELSESFSTQNGNVLVVTPLFTNNIVTYTNNPGYFRRLVTEIDKKEEVKKVEMYEIVGDIKFILSNYKTLLDVSNSKRLKDFRGGILVTDYNTKIKNGKNYNSDNVLENIDIKSKSKNKNVRSTQEECWGLYLTHEDGTEELLSWWCSGTNNQDQAPDSGSSSGSEPNNNDDGAPNYRGVIQFQWGSNTESESWAQSNPPTKGDGYAILDRVYNKLTNSQKNAFQCAYQNARNRIATSTLVVNNYSHYVNQCCPNCIQALSNDNGARCDIQIFKGTAF